MAITHFDPVSYQLVKADGRSLHAEVQVTITANSDDTENAVKIDLLVKMADGQTQESSFTMRRDMAFNFAHRTREELQKMGVLGHGEHAVNASPIFMQSKAYDMLFKKVRAALNIDPTETIDLDRFIHSGDSN
ncbi:DUF5064 family protein [Aestuariirhabdus litorea]|uniref:DUF5064 family protein n=1 Tax=Aestuariirhabdus litorea TaxID=2528527 RepID=A0A3P3VRC9_9GAMM|nr:DUF5064 family protein [Aestuariirhabdus litorea]RRJ84079.1 DUF5064 family protein [Aestuariirhabdus litorea]RWW97299.1 DUF5064 family protein [Endozoicomonadaceae bacterium GTF-13]